MQYLLAYSARLQNAIENTSEGGTVTLSGYKEKHMAIINITDTGIGIDKREHKKYFVDSIE